MTREEMREIWDLLGAYRPGDKRLTDKKLMTAWWMTFEPYHAQDVRQAMVSYFREKRFFPDIKELTALLPPLPGQGPDATRPQRDVRAERRAHKEMDDLRSQWHALRKRRRELGVPETISEALAQGLPPRQWGELLDSRGLDFK